MSNPNKSPRYRCDDCGYTADIEKFNYARDLSMRLDPGGTYTDMECPKVNCGALAYPVMPKTKKKKKPQSDNFMTIQDALDIVLDLAQGNITQDPDRPESEKKRQELAIGVVTDFYVSHLGDD